VPRFGRFREQASSPAVDDDLESLGSWAVAEGLAGMFLGALDVAFGVGGRGCGRQ